MKKHYKKPIITVDELEKSDILLASDNGGQSSEEPGAKELENAYRDVTQFVFNGSWFD